MDAEAIRRALPTNCARDYRTKPASEGIVLAGIPHAALRSPARIAAFIREIDKADVDTGVIDVAMYRDDVGTARNARRARVETSGTAGDRTMIIVDDVLLYRSHRACGDGRPKFVRSSRTHSARCTGRSWPSRAADSSDYVGKNLPTATREQIQVRLQETDNEPDGVWLKENECDRTISGERTLAAAVDVRIMTARWTRKDLVRPARLVRRRNQFCSRHRRRIQTSRNPRDQKGAGLRGRTLVNFFVEPSTRTRTYLSWRRFG